MTQFSRHILTELLKVFLIALLGMTTFMILVGLARQAVREGLGLAPILRMVPFVVPNALRFAVPGTILFAACSVYGRMAANNEVVAVKALGISPVALLRPVLTFAFLVSLVAVWLNDIAVSWGTTGVRRVIVQSIEEIAYGMLRTHKTYSPTNQLTISVQRVEGHKLIRPAISIHTSDDSPGVTVTARSAEMRYEEEKDSLSVFLTDSEVYGDFNEKIHGMFPTLRREIPLSLAPKDKMGKIRPSDCPSRRIPDEMRHQREVIVSLESRLAAEAAFDMLSGDVGNLGSELWRDRRKKLGYAHGRLQRLKIEPWRRWANGFSCFFFVLVGAPLAMRLRNSDLFTTFGACFVPILIIYYPLLMAGVDQAKSGRLPPYCVWLGNAILCVVGLALIKRNCQR